MARVVYIAEAKGGFVIITETERKLPDGHKEHDIEKEIATSTDDLINKLNTLFTPTEKSNAPSS